MPRSSDSRILGSAEDREPDPPVILLAGPVSGVARYVTKCETCQKFTISQQRPFKRMNTRLVHATFDVLWVDFVRPLPRSTHGNIMLLVFFDAFLKWLELRSFREWILARFGVPKIIVYDKGTQFTSRAVATLHTTPCKPLQNPTERANQIVKTMVAQYLDNQQLTWDEHLPKISPLN